MYTPKAFKENDPTRLNALMRAHPLHLASQVALKLSRNRGAADRAGVIAALATDERDPVRETARLMRQLERES